jgi:hypothetical protein
MHGMKLTVTALVFLVAAIFFSMPAQAGLHHDHHSTDSPFHKASKGKPVHCILLGHSINNPCPHILNPKTQMQRIVIGPDCGGLPFPTKSIPFPPLNKFFLNYENLFQKSLVGAEKFYYPPDLYNTPIFRSIDHPPQA